MNHLRFLKYFDEVVRAGSIRLAAERLHVAPSAVNRRIQDLEEELGLPLFERLPRGMRLTAAGELFVTYVRGRQALHRRSPDDLVEATTQLAQVVARAPTFAPTHAALADAWCLRALDAFGAVAAPGPRLLLTIARLDKHRERLLTGPDQHHDVGIGPAGEPPDLQDPAHNRFQECAAPPDRARQPPRPECAPRAKPTRTAATPPRKSRLPPHRLAGLNIASCPEANESQNRGRRA